MHLNHEIRGEIFPVLEELHYRQTACIPFKQHDRRIKDLFAPYDRKLQEKARRKENINFYYCAHQGEFFKRFPLNHQQKTLYDFFVVGKPVKKEDIIKILSPAVVDRQIKSKIFREKETEITAAIKVIGFLDDYLVTENLYEDQFAGVHLGKDSFVFLDFLKNNIRMPKPGSRVLEIGVGSGILLKFLNSFMPGARFVGVDINEKALHISQFNLPDLANLELLNSDGFAGITGEFALIIANPPFVFAGEKKHLYDFGGKDGLEVLEKILIPLKHHWQPQGQAFFIAADIKYPGEETGRLVQLLKKWNRENRCSIEVEAVENVFSLNPGTIKYWHHLDIEKISLCCIKMVNDGGNRLISKDSTSKTLFDQVNTVMKGIAGVC